VGHGLQDHVVVAFHVLAPPGVDVGAVNASKAEGFPSGILALLEWLLRGRGLLASSTHDATLFCSTGVNPHFPYPDVQLSVLCTGGDHDLFYKNLNLNPSFMMPQSAIGPQSESFLMVATLLHPYSRGSVRLRSSDPHADPVIDPNYLEDERDVRTLVAGCKIVHGLLAQAAFEGVCGQVLFQEDIVARHAGRVDDAFWEDYVRHIGVTLYHPTATCAIGQVVDPFLCVKGMQGLRVVDASVMPRVISGNTNAPCIMIGEKAADLIAEEHNFLGKRQRTLAVRDRSGLWWSGAVKKTLVAAGLCALVAMGIQKVRALDSEGLKTMVKWWNISR
jgi:hypothetical protein